MINDVVPPKRPRPKPKHRTPPNQPEEASDATPIEKPEVDFKPPEVVAEEEVSTTPPASTQAAPTKAKRRWWPHTRRQWIFTSVAVALFMCGAGGSWVLTLHHKPTVQATTKKVVVKKTTKAAPVLYSNLSGLPITDPSLNQKPVTAVMVENSLDARPQSGLSQAGVVFEAQAEGGVTRFMALYQDTAPDNVGPIRSARPYYVQWALGFDAAYAHVGGSPDALSDITSWNVQDMNQFYNGSYYHRVSSRAAPHNVYTAISTLNQLEAKKNYSSTFTGFQRASKQTPLAEPTASSISLAVSGPLYNPSYTFNAGTNTYNRSTDGTPDTDANTGQQLSPTVVVALVVPLSRGALDASGAYYSDYNVLGNGTAYIFQNGGVTEGQWHKADNATQLSFTDTSGNAIPLNRGQTWITAVSAASQVTYKGTTPASTGK